MLATEGGPCHVVRRDPPYHGHYGIPQKHALRHSPVESSHVESIPMMFCQLGMNRYPAWVAGCRFQISIGSAWSS
jgi:hypothetical protein